MLYENTDEVVNKMILNGVSFGWMKMVPEVMIIEIKRKRPDIPSE